MSYDSALYSQHIKGRHNIIADSLSRDHHLNITQLTNSFLRLYPDQTPPNFQILPLPAKIVSWLRSLSRSSIKSPVSLPRPCKSKLGALIDGSDSLATWELKTSGCLNISKTNASTSSPHSRAVAEEITMVRRESKYSAEKPSRPPSQMYVRLSGRTYGQTRR